jgi:hypothetical protein
MGSDGAGGERERGTPAELAVSRQDLAAVSDEVASYFPQPFDETRIVLMVVDPHDVHAYWHVRPEDMEAARRQMGADASHAPMVLRLYDITLIDFSKTPAHGYFDAPVHGLQNNWYVELWQDSKSYVADLGLRRPDGSVVALARSNVVHTPLAHESSYYRRAGIVLEPDGTVREIPDILQPGALSPGPSQPTPAMPQEEVTGLVRQAYGCVTETGRPGLERAFLPRLRSAEGAGDGGHP